MHRFRPSELNPETSLILHLASPYGTPDGIRSRFEQCTDRLRQMRQAAVVTDHFRTQNTSELLDRFRERGRTGTFSRVVHQLSEAFWPLPWIDLPPLPGWRSAWRLRIASNLLSPATVLRTGGGTP